MTLHCQNVAIWLGLLVAVASGEGLAAGPASTERLAESAITHAPTIEAYWTDTPPVLDGDTRDACWIAAPAATNFMLLGTNTSARYQTAVRVCYDAEFLYVCIRADAPPLAEDEREGGGRINPAPAFGEELPGYDQAGFLLAQPYPDVECFYFAVNALGSRADNRSPATAGSGKDKFHVLESQVSRDASGWSAEMRVPFVELGSLYANLGATPPLGTAWNILFFREHDRFKEHSTWPAAGADYRKERDLGRIAFKGRRTGEQIPSVSMSVPNVEDGFAEIRAVSDRLLRCEYVQIRHGSNPDRGTLLDKGEQVLEASLRLPWIVGRDPEYFRNYRICAKVYQEDRLVFVGNGLRAVLPGYIHYDASRKSLDVNLHRLQGVPGERAERLRGELTTLRERCEAAKQRLDACERVGDKQWEAASRELYIPIRNKALQQNPEYRFMPYILRSLHATRTALAAAGDRLNGSTASASIREIGIRVAAMRTRLDALSAQAETCTNTLDAVTNLMSDASALAFEGEGLDFDVWRVTLADAHPSVPLVAFPLSAYAKTFPRRKFEAPRSGTVALAAAGGEGESFQVCLVPLRGAVENVTVAFSPLAPVKSGGARAIPASSLSWRIVHHVRMLGADAGVDPFFDTDPDSTFPRPWYPDPLYPGSPFTLPADEQMSVWTDIHCPPDTPAGDYTGTMTVAAGDFSVRIPVRLTVYGFNLPAKPSLRINHWFAPVYGKKLYGDDASDTYTPEMFEQDSAFLAQYRLPHFLDERAPVMENVTLYHEGGGRITADFTELAKFYDIAEKYGANWVRASFGCNNGVFSGWGNGWYRVIERRTGEEKTLLEVFPDYCADMKAGRKDDFDNPAWRQFVNQFADFLDKRGLLENNAYFEVRDEAGVDDVIEAHKKLREICPRMPLGNYGPHPLEVNRWGETSAAYTDIWGPLLQRLDDPELEAAVRDRVENHGEKCMAYLCHSRGNVPHLSFHRSFLGPRLAHWQVWRHKIDAFLMFKLNATPHTLLYKNKKLMAKPLETRFDGPWDVAKDMEDWACHPLYPGPDRTLIPGMRLAALRDGMEDYEYFYLLKTLTDAFQPESDEDRALLQKARAALDIPRDICGRVNEWTTDEDKVNAHRAKLAEWIVRLQRRPE